MRREPLTDGSEVLVGYVVLMQKHPLLIEPSVAALTEYLRNQLPAAYRGEFHPHPQDRDFQPEQTECRVRIVALAGKDFRFTTEQVV